MKQYFLKMYIEIRCNYSSIIIQKLIQFFLVNHNSHVGDGSWWKAEADETRIIIKNQWWFAIDKNYLE